MKKVLITGVAGFIGSKVAAKFISEGFEVYGIDDLSGGKKENIPLGIYFIKANLAKKDEIKKIPAGCHLILHLAGQSSGEISFDDPVSDLAKNTVSTLNLIEYGILNQSDKILYASSMSVYGDVPDEPINENVKPVPLSCYGVGKLASEGYLKVYQDKLNFVALRMFNVYGPGQDLQNMRQGMVSIFLAHALTAKKVVVKGSLERFRDFVFIDDVVDVWYNAAISESTRNLTINVGTGIKTTVRELLSNIQYYLPDIEIIVSESTKGDQSGIYPNIERLNELIPVSKFIKIDQGVDTFVQWAKSEIYSRSINK
jgi:UDP-glucose 4-epimerase